MVWKPGISSAVWRWNGLNFGVGIMAVVIHTPLWADAASAQGTQKPIPLQKGNLRRCVSIRVSAPASWLVRTAFLRCLVLRRCYVASVASVGSVVSALPFERRFLRPSAAAAAPTMAIGASHFLRLFGFFRPGSPIDATPFVLVGVHLCRCGRHSPGVV